MTRRFGVPIKFKKLHPEAVIPEKANHNDAGLDLVAISKEYKGSFIEYGTGLAIEIPPNHVGLIFPRSSISLTPLTLANSVGVIDAGYRGEIKLRFKSASLKPLTSILSEMDQYHPGDRVGQLVIMPIPQLYIEEVDELSDTERGEGGFGSSGA